MKDQDKTKEQLVNELAGIRQRVAQLQAADTERKRAEEALQKQKEELQVIFDSVPALIFYKDLDNCIMRANRTWFETLGFPEEVVIGKPLSDFLPKEQADQFLRDDMEVVTSGQPKRNIPEAIEVGNDTRLFTTDKIPYRDEKGNIAGVIGFAQDITERKRAEEAQRESEELLRATLESTADGILVIGENGKMIHANIRFAKMWRIPQPVLDSRDDDTLLAFVLDQLQDPEAFLTKVRYLYGSSEEDLDTLQFKDGRVFERFSRPLLQDGMVAGRVWSFRDITERAQAEEALCRRAEELATLQATVLDITAPHDLPTLLQTIVKRAARLLDAPVGGLYLCDPDQQEARCVVSYNTPRDYTGTVLKYGEGAAGTVAQTGEPLIIDDYRTWSGRAAVYEKEHPFTAVLSAPMIWQGQVTGVIHVLHNVESRRFTQADLELLTLFANHAAVAVENARLYEEALQDAKTKATLLDEVNHRVKNTLVAIIGLLHVEQEYAEMADQATYEAIIANLTNRVSGLATVHDLLSASEWEPLPLSDLAGQVIKSAMQMRPRDKQVFIDVPPSPVRVTADQAHNLAIVINELATNTIQHTLPGRGTARISVRITLEDDNIVLEIRDDGPGYPEDVLQLERHAVGFDLIQNLARQSLHGELSFHNDEGAVAAIRFPAQA